MRIAIVGDAVVLTSTLKVGDIELLKKYKPDALKLTDEDGKQIFGVAYESGRGTFSKTGIVFGGTARDGSGYATLTVNLESDGDVDVETLKSTIADMLGDVPTKVGAIESTAPAAVEEIGTARETLINSITIL